MKSVTCPSPVDEAKRLLVETACGVPNCLQRLNEQLEEEPQTARRICSGRFTSWMGGDRDEPNVIADITATSCYSAAGKPPIGS